MKKIKIIRSRPLKEEEVIDQVPQDTAPEQPEITYESNPLEFMLQKYPTLTKTLVELLTDDFRNYIVGVYIMAPKPTIFKIVLHNNRSFHLIFMGDDKYEAKVSGKKYWLSSIDELERATIAIADLLMLGTPPSTQGPETEMTATPEETPEETPAEETPAEEETPEEAPEELAEGKLGIRIIEARTPYESLTGPAKKEADKLIKIFKLTKDNIKKDTNNRIIILSDIPRAEIFKKLEDLKYKRDPKISNSSSGGYRTPEGIEIITKSEAAAKVGGAGVDNELTFVNFINNLIQENGGSANVTIKGGGKTLKYNNVTEAKHVGKEGEKKGWKADALLIAGTKTYPISLKKDGPFRWASAMEDLKTLYTTVLTKAYNKEIPNLQLKADPQKPKVLQMWNPKTKSPYGRIFVTNVPQLTKPENVNKIIFGVDNAVVVQRTFSESDFTIDKNTITVVASKIVTSLKDLKPEDYPIVEFERNASKANKTKGIFGRGIVIRISPRDRMDDAGPGANNLILNYKDVMS